MNVRRCEIDGSKCRDPIWSSKVVVPRFGQVITVRPQPEKSIACAQSLPFPKRRAILTAFPLRGSRQNVDPSQTGQATAGAPAPERDRSQLFLEINAAILSHAG